MTAECIGMIPQACEHLPNGIYHIDSSGLLYIHFVVTGQFQNLQVCIDESRLRLVALQLFKIQIEVLCLFANKKFDDIFLCESRSDRQFIGEYYLLFLGQRSLLQGVNIGNADVVQPLPYSEFLE